MADREYAEIGDGIYIGRTGPDQEGTMAAPNGKNRVWLTPEGPKRATKDMPETDLDRLRKSKGL